MLSKHVPQAIFSMGGYAAGPVVLAGMWKRLPIVVMEPNAIPGLANRHVGRFVTQALLNFPETARFFPPGKSTITGLPVRPEFFAIRPKARDVDRWAAAVREPGRSRRATSCRAVRNTVRTRPSDGIR